VGGGLRETGPIVMWPHPGLRPSWHLPPPHFLLHVQVQEVGGVHAAIHALLVPGQAAAHSAALGCRTQHELSGFIYLHRRRHGPLLLLGGQRVHQPWSASSPTSAGPGMVPRQGRPCHSPLSVCRENTAQLEDPDPWRLGRLCTPTPQVPSSHHCRRGSGAHPLLLICVACG
jgi:hypothetical protein